MVERPGNVIGLPGLDDGLGLAGVLEIQRVRLLAGMREACEELGAGNVTVAHVVQRAGVSRRTFYELFADREECFLAAFDDGIARMSRHVLDVYDPDASWVQRLRVSLTALLGLFELEPQLGRLLLVDSLGAGACALERRQRALDRAIAAVDEGRSHATGRMAPPPLTAEGVVGGIVSILSSRLQRETPDGRLVELMCSLMSMIVLPYLGAAAARRELARPLPSAPIVARARERGADPLRELGIRLTYRTVRVLMAVAAQPGGSNRQVAEGSGIGDQGQISKLLARLQRLGLIENAGAGSERGAPNSWVLTERGWEVQGAIPAGGS